MEEELEDETEIEMTVVADRRLKKNIKILREHKNMNNIRLYEWEWNEEAEGVYGLEGQGVGCMAHEIEIEYPEAVKYDEEGYKVIDINKYPEDPVYKMLCVIEVENLKNRRKK